MTAKARKWGAEISGSKFRVALIKTIMGFLAALLLLGSSPLAGWAAGGNLMVFLRGDNVWIANSDGTGARQLTSGGQAAAPALSPDGRWVAFTSQAGNKSTVSLVPAGGGPVKALNLAGVHDSWSPVFTPDGQQLAMVTRSQVKRRQVGGEQQEYATHAISLVDLNKGTVRHVLKTPNHFMDAGNLYDALAVSPDGRFLAYQDSGTDVSGGFVVLTLDGKKVARFPKDPKNYHPYWRPTFSPDGSKVLCFSMAVSEGEKTYIYLVDLKTLKATRIIEGYYPTLVDGGKAMVFERWTETGLTGKEATKIDLWRLDFAPGAAPRLILENGERAAGQG